MGRYNPEYHREYYKRNRQKKIAYSREWKRLNPERSKGHSRQMASTRLKRVYGISLEEYDRLFEQQHGLCAICGLPETGKRLAVDHCHSSGKVRSLLCAKCNQGIGHFNDDVELLAKAMAYVHRHNGTA